ncbi:MAG TPA: UDP-N-acetylglucosamine 1-carboxyvinyltransferase [Candidatus Eremiobacteraceae bacterium]|nr:UDP-N-acetylglucosamine 1-carboxyvinyltransferase [Candidatus Eremiobacteraceae bacterium]
MDSLEGLRTKLIVEGGHRLEGVVAPPGAKNAALPIMAAAILCESEIVLHRVPRITDVDVMTAILESLGARVREQPGGTLVIDASSINSFVAPYALVSKLNASFDVTGALLGRFGRAEVPRPGGCVLGPRAVDMHLRGFELLGATVDLEHGSVVVRSSALRGNTIGLSKPSVGATKNIMLASVRAKGTTTLENAAREPEVVDLADFLNAMGARISGQGSDTITIEGVSKLHACEYTIIPDRLVAGTYLLAGAITRGDVTITGVDPAMLAALRDQLLASGCDVQTEGVSVRVRGSERWRGADVTTAPYPGFPTDLQPPLVAYLSLAHGESKVEETIFDARFVYVDELLRMGADITVSGRTAQIVGVAKLKDAVVEAPDIRAGGALVLAALAAEGTSEIGGLEYIDRGYEFFEERLASLGATVVRASGVAPVMPQADIGNTVKLPRIVTPFRAQST